jgi:hypothetical protein
MYGALTDAKQRETLFIEYLDVVAEREPCERFLKDARQFPRFLGVVAHFNAIQPSEEYAARLRQDMAQRPGPSGWDGWLAQVPDALDRVWEHASRGDLGEALQRLFSADSRDKLKGIAHRLIEPVAQMEAGLAHNDCYPHCTGWRRDTGELLLFDLEDVGFGPRFCDVAPWLGAPDAIQPRCGPREELSRHYLSEYGRWGGNAPPLGQFLEETRILWMTYALLMLEWYLNEILNGPADRTKENSEEHQRYNRDALHRQLSILIAEAS